MPRETNVYLPVIAVILLFLVLLSGFIPSLFNSTQGDSTQSITLESGEIIDIQSPLETTLHEKSGEQLNISVLDSNSGDKASLILTNESSNATVSLGGQNITATYVHEIDTTSAIVQYTYPTFYDNSGIQILFWREVLGLLLVVTFLYMVMVVSNIGVTDERN